ncbi:MAG: 4-hydroxy-tetrahydrodipicolinate reductase [Oligoflexales bacterium]|nr:4-hydroxy-tetrahydrodipicolinate reductase [Oligoflexales bacterium]
MSAIKKIWINGISGRMGQKLCELIDKKPQDFSLAGGFAKEGFYDSRTKSFSKNETEELLNSLFQADLIIDFSLPEANKNLRELLARNEATKIAVLLATTGLPSKDLEAWSSFSKTHKNIKVLLAPNTSLGITLLVEHGMSLAKVLLQNGFDMELIETHHRYKKDAPSGTALYIKNSIDENLKQEKISHDDKAIHALRGGGVFGEHNLRFISDEEEIEISHRALNRDLFAKGALKLGSWLLQQKPGVYGLKDVRY